MINSHLLYQLSYWGTHRKLLNISDCFGSASSFWFFSPVFTCEKIDIFSWISIVVIFQTANQKLFQGRDGHEGNQHQRLPRNYHRAQ